MKVLMFQTRFVPLIVSGKKAHTIRPRGKRDYLYGEVLSLRHWAGKAYRSKQAEFARATVSRCESVAIFDDGVSLDDGSLRAFWMGEGSAKGRPLLDLMARNDGFADWLEMKQWFKDAHGLPFKGRVIHFELLKVKP